jgi:hypothetical protein
MHNNLTAKKVLIPKRNKAGHVSGYSIATTHAAVSSPAPVSAPSPLLGKAAAMVTFPVNPLAFLPKGMNIDQGPPYCKVHTDLVVPAIAPLQNDRVLVAKTNRFIPIHLFFEKGEKSP